MRSYHQQCALAYGIDLLGERWTILILRELLIRPCRFKDLLENLDGIGTNLLSQRLRDLERAGMVERVDDSKRSAYRLTDRGFDVEGVILELIRWGYASFQSVDTDLHRDHWDLLPMKAFFRRDCCERDTVVQFESPSLTAWVAVSPDGFSHGMGLHADADRVVPTTIKQFQQDLATGRYNRDASMQAFAKCFDVPARTVSH